MPRDSHSPGYPVYLSYSPRALAIHVTLAQTPGTARTAIALLLRTYYTLHPVTVPCPLATWKKLSHLVQTEWNALHPSGAPPLPYAVTEFCTQADRLHHVVSDAGAFCLSS